MQKRYWKILRAGQSANSGFYDWRGNLPTKSVPGAVLPFRPVVICQSGWHFATDRGLGEWLKGTDQELYLARGIGKSETDGDQDKVAFESGQLLTRIHVTPRVFATFLLEGLNLLPTKRMKPGVRAELETVKTDVFLLSVGDKQYHEFERDNTVEQTEEFVDALEDLYSDYNRKMPKALIEECALLRGIPGNFEEVYDAVYEGMTEWRMQIIEYSNALQDVHRKWKGPLSTADAVATLLGDVLEREAK